MTSGIRRARAGMERGLRDYDSAVSPTAQGMQDALVSLLGGGHPIEGGSVAGRMAASKEALALLKALPAAAVVGGGLGMSELVTGDDSFANKGMDALGMGAGGIGAAYGINRGVDRLGGTTKAGMALRIAAGMGLGKLGSDATQGAMGGMF